MTPLRHDPEGLAELAMDLAMTGWDRGLIPPTDDDEAEA